MARSYRCKECKEKRGIEMEIIMHGVSRFCSKSCRLAFTREKKRKENKKIKIRKAKKKEKKANSVKVLTKKADILWAECVKIKDWYKCVYCWEEKNLNSHHIIWRSSRSVRWDINNGVTLCSLHHIFSSEISAHGQPLIFLKWLENEKGEEAINKLIYKSNIVTKVSSEMLLEIINDLKLYKKVEQLK